MFDIIDGNIEYFFTAARHRDIDVPEHVHGNLEIVIVTEGVLTMRAGEREYQLPAGTGAFVPPFISHAYPYRQPHAFHALMFTKELVPHFYNLLKDNTAARHSFSVSPESIAILEHFLPEQQSQDNYFRAQAVLAPIICEIYEKCRFTPCKTPLTDTFYSALEYMAEHATEKIDRENVAKAVGVHPITLSKCFSNRAYCNFTTALNQLRCTHAALLMKKGGMTFAEIAFATGFGSIRSFNRAFLEIYHTTPSDFRKAQASEYIN